MSMGVAGPAARTLTAAADGGGSRGWLSVSPRRWSFGVVPRPFWRPCKVVDLRWQGRGRQGGIRRSMNGATATVAAAVEAPKRQAIETMCGAQRRPAGWASGQPRRRRGRHQSNSVEHIGRGGKPNSPTRCSGPVDRTA